MNSQLCFEDKIFYHSEDKNSYHPEDKNSYHPEDMNYTGNITEKHGVYTTKYTNGNIKSLCTYEHGKLHGLSQSYDLYGNIISESVYKNGSLNGLCKIYFKTKTESVIEPKIYKTIIYKDNVKIGLEKVYLEDGTLFITYDHSFGEF
jgi:antitoxin component YwqK of YwqJK toxin-antitoxin module